MNKYFNYFVLLLFCIIIIIIIIIIIEILKMVVWSGNDASKHP